MSLEDYFIILGPHRNCANAWLGCCRMPLFGDLHPARTGRWLQWTSSPADANQRRFRRSRGYSSSQASDEKPHSSSSSLGFAATDVRCATLRASCCMAFFCGSEKPPDSVLWHEHHRNAFVLSCCSIRAPCATSDRTGMASNMPSALTFSRQHRRAQASGKQTWKLAVRIQDSTHRCLSDNGEKRKPGSILSVIVFVWCTDFELHVQLFPCSAWSINNNNTAACTNTSIPYASGFSPRRGDLFFG